MYIPKPLTFRDPGDRTPDSQYYDLLQHIYENGRETRPIHGGTARMIFGAQLRYEIANGFPIINERDFHWGFSAAVAEIIGFIHGAHTLEQLREYGVPDALWKDTVTAEKCAVFGLEEGDLGAGSYGPALAAHPTAEGEPFNQVEHLLHQMREMPYLRTHVLTTHTPQYVLQHGGLRRKVVTAPCHGVFVHFLLFADTRELQVHHLQRSGDFPTGVPFNMAQYAALGAMFAQALGYGFTEIVYTFSDVHIYESQLPHVEELLARSDARILPSITMNPEVTDLFAFSKGDFGIGAEYEPYPKMKIPTLP